HPNPNQHHQPCTPSAHSWRCNAGSLIIQNTMGWDGRCCPSTVLLLMTAIYTMVGGLTTTVIITDASPKASSLFWVPRLSGRHEHRLQIAASATCRAASWPRNPRRRTTTRPAAAPTRPQAFHIHAQHRPNDPRLPLAGSLLWRQHPVRLALCTDQLCSCAENPGVFQEPASTPRRCRCLLMIIPAWSAGFTTPTSSPASTASACERLCGIPEGCSNVAYIEIIKQMLPHRSSRVMIAAMLAPSSPPSPLSSNSGGTLFTIDLWLRLRRRAGEVDESHRGQGVFWGLLVSMVIGVVWMVLNFVYPAAQCGEADTPACAHRPAALLLHFGIALFAFAALIMTAISLLTKPVDREQTVMVHTPVSRRAFRFFLRWFCGFSDDDNGGAATEEERKSGRHCRSRGAGAPAGGGEMKSGSAWDRVVNCSALLLFAGVYTAARTPLNPPLFVPPNVEAPHPACTELKGLPEPAVKTCALVLAGFAETLFASALLWCSTPMPNGELSASEFIKYFILLHPVPGGKLKCKIVFDIIDRDSSGCIELAEIRRYYHDLPPAGPTWWAPRDSRQLTEPRQVDKLFSQIDSDSNKKVDAKEFEQHARTSGPELLQAAGRLH
uniref:Sodium/myo-inositol cotransporter 2 n=1 Tax=Macrostomum lignano TaxID=282301 RepID=A0A1I8FD16_9PLAT